MTATYQIAEVARRSGFPASTLRYYEDVGLVAPADRTDAGYRLYDDRSLAKLAFIARAKQLGCTLEEITDLVSAWEVSAASRSRPGSAASLSRRSTSPRTGSSRWSPSPPSSARQPPR